jgi:hypothetical protein
MILKQKSQHVTDMYEEYRTSHRLLKWSQPRRRRGGEDRVREGTGACTEKELGQWLDREDC